MHSKPPAKAIKMKHFSLVAVLLLVVACGEEAVQEKATPVIENEQSTILDKVDELNERVQKSASSLELIASLDHHRMAEEEGVYTPPAIASIWSDPSLNTKLIAKHGPLIGLDLPLKFLCYAEADTIEAELAFTSGPFIARRHGIAEEELVDLDAQLSSILNDLNTASLSQTSLDSVQQGFGIIAIRSDFGFDTTIANLKSIIDAQSDTRWFGEVDYKKDAEASNEALGPATLLLFGGPAPGGKAMMNAPKIGLDAFCQKLLIYENSDGEVWIAFNEIVAFAKLYYGEFTKPQAMIDKRLTATFTKAVKLPTE